MYVTAILKSKGGSVETVGPGQSVEDAAKKLRGKGIGSLVVSDDKKSVNGIISERDILRGLAEIGSDVLKSKVSDLMTREVVTCQPEDDVEHLMNLMTTHRIRHLPVIDGNRLIGVVSIGDVVKALLTETRSEAEAMRAYISAST